MHETDLYSIILRYLCHTVFGAWLKSMGWNQIEADEITGKLEKEEEHTLSNFGSVKSGQKYLWVPKDPCFFTHVSC